MMDNSSVLTDIDDAKIQYPHIAQEMAANFIEIGATEKQWEVADVKAKDNIDRLLEKYKYIHEPGATGGTNPKEIPSLLNILVIGTTGSGKSATTNTLIGHKWCEEGSSAESVPSMVCAKVNTIHDTNVVVGDTPGSWESRTRIPGLDGVDCYIIVVNLASPQFSQETFAKVKSLKGVDGSLIVESGRFIVVLSHADSALQQISLTQYLDEIAGDPLHTFLTKVAEGRVVAVNNAVETEYQRKRQQEALFDLLLQVYNQLIKKMKTSLKGGVRKVTSFTKRIVNKIGLKSSSGSPKDDYCVSYTANPETIDLSRADEEEKGAGQDAPCQEQKEQAAAEHQLPKEQEQPTGSPCCNSDDVPTRSEDHKKLN